MSAEASDRADFASLMGQVFYMTDGAEATAAPLPSYELRELGGMLRGNLQPRLPQTLLPSPRESRLAEEPTDPPRWPPSSQRALYRGNRDRQARQRAHARLQRDVAEAEMAYASWAARRGWPGGSSAAWSGEAVERVVFEDLAQRLQQAVAAELCDFLTRRPDFWEPDEPARLAIVLQRWARRTRAGAF